MEQEVHNERGEEEKKETKEERKTLKHCRIGCKMSGSLNKAVCSLPKQSKENSIHNSRSFYLFPVSMTSD